MPAPTTEPLHAYLNRTGADTARVELATRFLLAQWTDYLPPASMPEALAEAGLDSTAIESVQAALVDDPALLREAALDVMSAAWQDPVLRSLAVGSLEEAASRLPAAEIATIAVAVMYGMWLLTTGGRRTVVRTVRRGPDGSYEEIEATEWYDPVGPLRAVVDQLSPTNGPLGAPPAELPGDSSQT